jgi:formylglycine-generating enzyme required for sulfatase activity
MGDTGKYSGDSNESPTHTVTFANDFYVGKYEITQAQWLKVMGRNPSHFSQCGIDLNLDCPVEQVSWNKVQEFIEKLNSQTSKTYRLLSEAEWEYAAKAGITTDTYAGDLDIKGDNLSTTISRTAPILDAISYYGGNSGVSYVGSEDCSGWPEKQHTSNLCGTHSVGGKQPNAFNLYDMMGNVGEWTQDCYNDSYDGAPVDGSVWLAGNCPSRVFRGGSWPSIAQRVRSSNRLKDTTGFAIDSVGFRLAISASEL